MLHGNNKWNDIEQENGHVKILSNTGEFNVDYIIVGTGCVTDLSLRPELENVVDKIALWKDRFTPPENERNDDMLRHPYLGSHCEFTEKNPGEAPYLASIFNFTFGGLVSIGFGGASISGMKYSIQKLVNGITKQLYLEDAEAFYQSLEEFDLREF